jgi:histidinol phosphatase-like PHP family hydrolase
MRYVLVADTFHEHVGILRRVESQTQIKVIAGAEHESALYEMPEVPGAVEFASIYATPQTKFIEGSAASFFEAWSKAISESKVKVVTHLHRFLPELLPEGELVSFYSRAVKYIVEQGLWLEVSPWFTDLEKRAANHLLTSIEKKKQVKVLLGTCAEYCEQVGRFHDVLSLFNTFEIDQKRVINTDEVVLAQMYSGCHIAPVPADPGVC